MIREPQWLVVGGWGVTVTDYWLIMLDQLSLVHGASQLIYQLISWQLISSLWRLLELLNRPLLLDRQLLAHKMEPYQRNQWMATTVKTKVILNVQVHE